MLQTKYIRIERTVGGTVLRAIAVCPYDSAVPGTVEVRLPDFMGHALEQGAENPPGVHSIAWPAYAVKVVEVER